MNIGIHAGNAPFVCMCNNDLVFHSHWARNILKAFDSDPSLMNANPYCGFFHGRLLPNPEAEVVPGYQNGLHVTGWCLFARRSVFGIIGELDERFTFWYCDDDYRLTLQKHGLKNALITTSRVDHLGSRTLQSEADLARRDQMTVRQRYFYEYKWGHRSWILYRLKVLKYHVGQLWNVRA
jgi:GT2 family glycosyltransferase